MIIAVQVPEGSGGWNARWLEAPWVKQSKEEEEKKKAMASRRNNGSDL